VEPGGALRVSALPRAKERVMSEATDERVDENAVVTKKKRVDRTSLIIAMAFVGGLALLIVLNMK
jgi:hypothetical protein